MMVVLLLLALSALVKTDEGGIEVDALVPLSQLEGYWKTNNHDKVHVVGTHMKMGTESFEIETTSDNGLVFDGYHLKTISNGLVEWNKEGTEALVWKSHMSEPESIQIEASVGEKTKTKPKKDKNRCFNVIIIPGEYDEEVSWHVKDRDGAEICSNSDTTTECCVPHGEYLKSEYFAHCYDSYGDGWDGYRILFDNEEVCPGFTDGRYRADTIIADRGNVETQTCFAVTFTAGDWDSEVRWHVESYKSGTEVCSKGDTKCCGEKGEFVVICEDTYGDGWNGYKLYFDNKEVCEDFTAGSYKESVLKKDKAAKSSVEMSVGAGEEIRDPLSQLEGYWKTNNHDKVHVVGTHMKMGTESFEIETTSDDGLVFDGYHLKTISNGVVEWTKEGTEALVWKSHMSEPESIQSIQIEASVGEKSKPENTNCFKVKIQPGAYDEEVDWRVEDRLGNVICNKENTSTACCVAEGESVKGEYFAHCYDSYGDGWDGYQLWFDQQEVCPGFNNGRYKQTTITKDMGRAKDEICFHVKYVEGSWDSEVQWYIEDIKSEKACSKGDTQCCGAKGDFFAICKDSYGDGWDGYQLWLDDQEVCPGFTTGYQRESKILAKVKSVNIEMSVGSGEEFGVTRSSSFHTKLLWMGIVFVLLAAIATKIYGIKNKRLVDEYSSLREYEL